MRRSIMWWTLIASMGISSLSLSAQAEPQGRITGVGGIFVTSHDPKALAAWYRDVLGIAIEPWVERHCVMTQLDIRRRLPGMPCRRNRIISRRPAGSS